jgi:hypothetical protein
MQSRLKAPTFSEELNKLLKLARKLPWCTSWKRRHWSLILIGLRIPTAKSSTSSRPTEISYSGLGMLIIRRVAQLASTILRSMKNLTTFLSGCPSGTSMRRRSSKSAALTGKWRVIGRVTALTRRASSPCSTGRPSTVCNSRVWKELRSS